MAENDLVRLRPPDVATVWGTAFGQIIDLWRTALTALMEFGSGEQPIASDQSNQFSVPSADGQMPHLTVRTLVGETFHERLPGRAVVFKPNGTSPGSVTVECFIGQAFQRIKGDTYTGQVVNERGAVVATVRLDAGS